MRLQPWIKNRIASLIPLSISSASCESLGREIFGAPALAQGVVAMTRTEIVEKVVRENPGLRYVDLNKKLIAIGCQVSVSLVRKVMGQLAREKKSITPPKAPLASTKRHPAFDSVTTKQLSLPRGNTIVAEPSVTISELVKFREAVATFGSITKIKLMISHLDALRSL